MTDIRTRDLGHVLIQTDFHKIEHQGWTIVVMIDHQPLLKSWRGRAYLYEPDRYEQGDFYAAITSDQVNGFDTLREAKIDIIQAVNRWLWNKAKEKGVDIVTPKGLTSV